MRDSTRKTLKIAGITILAVAAVATVATLFVRDQIVRQQRHLFNPFALKRLAALEHMARQLPSVDHINLLKDYIAWEPRKILRARAQAIVARMEVEALSPGAPIREPAA
jgi:hypothetical protein